MIRIHVENVTLPLEDFYLEKENKKGPDAKLLLSYMLLTWHDNFKINILKIALFL